MTTVRASVFVGENLAEDDPVAALQAHAYQLEPVLLADLAHLDERATYLSGSLRIDGIERGQGSGDYFLQYAFMERLLRVHR